MTTINRLLYLTPEQDETLYSWIARHHIMRGNVSFANTLFQFTGKYHLNINVNMPRGLKAIAKCISKGFPITADKLLMNYTTFPFFMFFMNKDKVNSVINILFYKDKFPINSFLGWGRFHNTTIEGNRYCPSCIEEDYKSKGFSYWRRSHLLPLVSTCHYHGTPLILQSNIINNNSFIPPLVNKDSVHNGKDLIISADLMKFAQVISYWGHEILHRTSKPYGNSLMQAYRNKLSNMGLCKDGCRIKRQYLIKEIVNKYGNDLLEHFNCSLNT
jgi:hypothetical protein